MPKKLQPNEQRRLEALGRGLKSAREATDATVPIGSFQDDIDLAQGDLLQGAIYAALEAAYPGRQKKKQLDAENDRATKAVLRFLARRTKSPNPRGL